MPGKLCLILASVAGKNNRNPADQLPEPITVNQDAKVFASLLAKGEAAQYDVARGRRAYLHLVTPTAGGRGGGHLQINGDLSLAPGDGLFVEPQTQLRIEGRGPQQPSHNAMEEEGLAEFLLFDLAA